MKRRNVDYDLFIAVAALLISTVAALASVYQTRIFATQLSATIWPYLSVQTRYPGDGSMSVFLTNDGVGPALVRSASATFDGKPVSSWNDVFKDFIGDAKREHRTAHVSATSVDQTTIVRPGESVLLLKLSASNGNVLVTRERNRLRLSFCYCSIQNRCWTMQSEAQGRPPADTSSCPQHQSIQAVPLVVE